MNRNKIVSSDNKIWQAWILLIAGLIATAVIAAYVRKNVEADAKREFDFACDEIRRKIDTRLNAHAQVLRSGAALFGASDSITREEWRAFTMDQRVEQHLPGIQGIGFSLLIPGDHLEQHIREIRAQGFPEYTVKPEGFREIYTSIIYLEPFSGRNLRAFGYDMFSEPVRREAMERARDTDSAALSGKVILVQETDKNVQPGTLMYVPVYRKGMPTDTIEQRRAALYGWVYSPYRMKDLMEGILGGWDLQDRKRIRLQVFDGEQLALLYDSQPDKESDSVSLFFSIIPIDFAGYRWTLRLMQTDGQESVIDFTKVWLVIYGGTIISMLMFGLLFSLLNTRIRARKIADRLTLDLRESEEKYRIIFNNEFFAICIFDLETLKFLDVNHAYTKLYGYSREELVSGMTIHDITVEHQVSDAATQQAVQEGTIFIPLRFHRKKDGTVFPLEIVGGPYTWKGQRVMFALSHDISDRKKAEEELRLFKTIIESSQESIAISDAEGRLVYINPAHEKLFGRLYEDAVKLNYRAYYPPESVEILEKEVVPAIARGESWEGELDVFDADGRRFPLWERTGSILDKNGKLLFAFGFMHDVSERKKIEAALRESEENFRAFFDTIDDLLFVLDNAGNMIRINRTVTKRLGYTTAELLGKNVLMVHPEERWDEAGRIVFEMLEGKRDYCPIPLRTRDGQSVPAETRIVKGKWSGQDVLFGVTKDISDIKASEEKFSKIFYNNPSAMAITDLENGCFADVNDAFIRITGYERNEVIGKTASELNLFTDMNHRNRALEIIAEQGYLRSHESNIRKKSGDIRYGVFSAEILNMQDRKLLLTMMDDITERKMAEKSVRDAALYTRSLIEASLDPLVTIGYDGRITDVNQATESVTGCSREELIGSNFSDYFTEPEKADAGYTQVFKTGSVRDYELHIRHKNGDITPVLYHASVYRDESGNILGVFAAARDISVRRRMEEERLGLERQLLNMKKFESLIRTASGISHNFNNILFAVTGNIEMAMDKIPSESPIRRTLEEAFKAANRAADLTRKILAYSGSGFFAFKEVNISSLIEKHIHAFRAAIPETISFNLGIAEDIPLISADSEQIQRLIMNILVNAVESLGEKPGTITLSTGIKNSDNDLSAHGFQRIDDYDEKTGSGHFVYVEISDTGCGMNEESLKLLFDPFFTTKFMGRGLGMSEVQGIVRTHKGMIFVKSTPGIGTTIRVLFPVADSAPKITERKPVHRKIAQADTLPKTILVADDEESVRDVCDMMLDHLGYRTMIAADGDEAVDIFKENADHIHCVLLDLTMPKKDGIAALKEMRHIREDVRIIISSGHSKEEIGRRFKDYRLSGILQKPFCLNDLRHELGSLMSLGTM